MPEPGTPDPGAKPGTTTGKPEDDPAAAGAAAAGGAGTGAADKSGEPEPLKLTQAELDAIVLNRTAQARRTASEAAEKAKKWDEYQATQQTEAEKLAAAQAKETARIAELEARARGLLVSAAVTNAAAAKGVRPEAQPLVVKLLLDSEEIVVSPEGVVTGVEAAVAKILTEHKYLVADPKDAPARKSGAEFTGEPGGKTLAEQLKEAEKDPRASISLKMRQLLTPPG